MKKFHRDNLTKLATYLEALPKDYKDFHMGVFNEEENDKVVVKDCGAVACAIGHGPNAKVLPLPTDEDWFVYAERVFGVELAGAQARGPLWDWCFSQAWEYTDNTPHGAALRIRAYIADNVPSFFTDEYQLECDPLFGPLYFEWTKQHA